MNKNKKLSEEVYRKTEEATAAPQCEHSRDKDLCEVESNLPELSFIYSF